tara:strand:- start:14040 stop:14459 length:420 start_codon:yes stop_codon:yes gene_type:complete
VAQYTLDDDITDDNCLFGIASHAKPYQLVSEINSHVGMKLKHSGKGVFPKKVQEEPIPHPYYIWEDSENNIDYYLFVNNFHRNYLIPTLKHAHYLLLVNCDVYLLEKQIKDFKTCQKILSFFDLNQHQKHKQLIYQWTL